MAVASLDPSAGWICGVVGVHPYQLAYADPRVAEEIWGVDTDTWVASPYAPHGIAKPVDFGYHFNGRWQFSSGTDHCEWIFLGAMVGDEHGKPVMPSQMLHMILPREDYEIVDDSWDVVGLRHTGSKDVVVRDAFVPDYRVMNAREVMDGTAQRNSGLTQTVYQHWRLISITNAIASARQGPRSGTIPMCSMPSGRRPPTSTVHARSCSPTSTESGTSSISGNEVTFADRATGRRTQVRAAWRALMAVDQISSRSGGDALRMDKPLQRYRRDAHAWLAHAIHVPAQRFTPPRSAHWVSNPRDRCAR